MPRPGFVLEVDERTPPLLVHEGEGFRLQKFPLGSRVIYPPDALPGIKDVRGAIRRALAEPHDSEPLKALLKPGMKLTIEMSSNAIVSCMPGFSSASSGSESCGSARARRIAPRTSLIPGSASGG